MGGDLSPIVSQPSSINEDQMKAAVSVPKLDEDNNNSSNAATADQSFMTVIQQAGMGGKTKQQNSLATVSHFDEIITNFVSRSVRRLCYRLSAEQPQNVDRPPELTSSATDSFAAVVMVDVSGYSKLTAALAERGPVGAELLSKTMKGYLDQIIEVIVSYGGDIVKFAGDAVVVYWSSESAINMTDSSEDIERGELVYKAAHCCLTLLTKLGTYDINIADCATKTLRIHLGIGAGLITDVVVGGSPGRWEHFIAGDGVNQLSQVLDLAKAGELALSHQALKWLVWVVDIRTLNLGDYDKRCIILTGLAKAERRVAAPKDVEEKLIMKSQKQKEDNMALYRNFMDRTALFKLQSDVNQSNLFQLDAGLLELLNLSELRQITTIFIKIGSLKEVTRDELLQQCQDAIQVVQAALSRCDGSLRQFQVDDKGAAILCFFGLPPLAHENDAKLGISAGIEIREKFSDMFEEFSMGITTGVVSFGGVGSTGRAEYAVMGDAINMAARLMCHRDAARGILCDEKTFNLCESDFQFENLGETTVKGKSSPIAIFRPVFSIAEADKNNTTNNVLLNSAVIGRETEKKAILANLEQLSSSPSVDILLVSAEGGLGLTTLVNFAKSEALKQGCHICSGKAVQMEQNNSFFVWRNVVMDLIHLVSIGSRNRLGHFRIPGNSGTVNLQDQIILPTSTLPRKPGSKPKRKDLAVATSPIPLSTISTVGSLPASEASPVGLTPNPNRPPGLSTLEKKPSRRPSTGFMKSPSSANEESGGFSPRRQSYTTTNSFRDNVDPNTNSGSSSFDNVPEDEGQVLLKFKKALEKIDLNETQSALLHLVTKSHEDESDAIAQAHLRLHAKDLCDILTKILNTITLNNKIVLQITEAHWVDSLSWDLLLELSVACPRLSIMTFSRPVATFESKENKRICKLIEQLPRSKGLVLAGLTAAETDMLILATWSGHTIKSVDPKIGETIHKRTDGNPFFIRSLVMALKESGQWRVSPLGALTTPDANFDFDRLVLGYDNQSIVLAQFDRLDRNFQLFLKVASVLGQKFALDDVLFFLTGIQNAADHVDRKNYSQIILGLQNTDKYGFLQKDTLAPDGAYFQFKSALVRKCIYSMMVHNQRQQIHLLVARYLEGKINEQNRHRYVVQILEHYMNTSALYKKKRIHYTAMAAGYFFEKDSPSETIKYNKQFLELIDGATPEELSEVSSLHIANSHRELGHALLLKEEYDDAEDHLKVALKIMGHTLPPDGYKFNWALKAAVAKRKKLDRVFFKDRPVPQEEDYTQSYVARKGASGYSLSNLVVAGAEPKKKPEVKDTKSERGDELKDNSGNMLPKLATLSPAQQMIRDIRESLLRGTQHALVTLAEVFQRKGNFYGHYYAILLGLNISTEESTEGHMSRLFGLGALALRHLQTGDVNLPAQYMEAAVSYDLRIDIHTSLKQVANNSTLLFLGGQLEASSNKCEVVSYLSTMASDLSSRVYGLHLKCMLQTSSSSREVALNTAKDLYNLSHQRESWTGKMWGCFHIIHNTLGDPNGDNEIQARLTEMSALWDECTDKKNANLLPIEIAKSTIQILVPYYKKNNDPDFKELIQDLHALISKIPFHQWQSFAGLLPVCLTLLAGIERSQPLDSATLKIVDMLCDTSNKALKSIKGLSMSGSLRRVFKGIRLIAKGKKAAAMKAWNKGIDDQSEDVYVQAILYSAIAKAGDSEESTEKAEDYIKDLKSKQKFAAIFS